MGALWLHSPSPIDTGGQGPGLSGSWHFRGLPAWILCQVWMDIRSWNCGAPRGTLRHSAWSRLQNVDLTERLQEILRFGTMTRWIFNVTQRSVKSILKGRGWIKSLWEGVAWPTLCSGKITELGSKEQWLDDAKVWKRTRAIPWDRPPPFCFLVTLPQISLPSGTFRDKWPSHYHEHATLTSLLTQQGHTGAQGLAKWPSAPSTWRSSKDCHRHVPLPLGPVRPTGCHGPSWNASPSRQEAETKLRAVGEWGDMTTLPMAWRALTATHYLNPSSFHLWLLLLLGSRLSHRRLDWSPFSLSNFSSLHIVLLLVQWSELLIPGSLSPVDEPWHQRLLR